MLRTGSIVLCLLLVTPAVSSDRVGSFRRQVEGLREPLGVAFTPDGTILVVEAADDCLRHLDADGTELEVWQPVAAAHRVIAPYGVSTSSDAVFLTDRGHDRVVVVDRDGTPLRAFGRHGSGPGELDRPAGIAAAGYRIYVADSGNDRIQVFDRDGADLSTIGRRGSRPGEFRRPLGVAVDDAGLVYVADTDNNRIQKLDAEGLVVRTWGERGSFPGLMVAPSAIAVQGDRVYVADGLGHRVQVFDRDGAFQYQWGMHAVVPREGEGRIHYPSGIAVSADGSTVVVAEAFERRIQIFGPLAEGEDPPGGLLPPGLDEQAHFGPMLAAGGPLLAVWEPPSQAISVFDVSAGEVPILVTRFGEPGDRFGQLVHPVAMMLDVPGSSGTDGGETMLAWWLDVVDAGAATLQRFRIDLDEDAPVRFDPFMARFAKAWALGVVDDEPPVPELTALVPALEGSGDGQVLAIDRRRNEVLELDGRRRVVRRFGGRGDRDGLTLDPVDLAIDRTDGPTRGRVYVADAWGRCVVAFDRDGALVGRWTHEELWRPAGIAVDSAGRVHLSDGAADAVFTFDPAGTLVRRWGETGGDQGQLWKPGAIRVDQRGRLVVVDYGNHRLQAFDESGSWLVTFGAGRAWTRDSRRAP